MSRKRKTVAALLWLFPPLYILLGKLLAWAGWLPPDDLSTIAVLVVGSLIFMGLMCRVMLDPEEDWSVRYARASRRVGLMSEFLALSVVAIGAPSLFYGTFGGYFAWLTFFLFIAMMALTEAAIIFRCKQPHSREAGGVVGALLATALVIPAMMVIVFHAAQTRESEYRPSCANNIKQLFLVCNMVASEGTGFPVLSSRPGYLSMTNMAEGYSAPIIPEYISDTKVLFCPQSPLGRPAAKFSGTEQEALDQSSYIYLGYVVKNEKELETFYNCYKERVAAGLKFDQDLTVTPGTGSNGGDKLLRLHVADLTGGKTVDEVNKDLAETPLLIERLSGSATTIRPAFTSCIWAATTNSFPTR